MGKFIVANIVGIVVLALLWAAGYLDNLIGSPAFPAICGLFGFIFAGLILIVLGKYRWAWWISDKMTVFGLAGTVTGMIRVFTHAVFEGDPVTVIGSMALGLGLALFSTLVGILGYLWLDWNLALQQGPTRE